MALVSLNLGNQTSQKRAKLTKPLKLQPVAAAKYPKPITLTSSSLVWDELRDHSGGGNGFPLQLCAFNWPWQLSSVF